MRRIRKFLTIEKAKILDNAFKNSQFNYAPLLWIFCRKSLYSKIEKIHHKTLKVIYESNGTYDNLLLQTNTVSVYKRHLKFLMTEYIKAHSNSTLNYVVLFHAERHALYFKKKSYSWLTKKSIILLWYECRTAHFRGSLICNNLPAVVKSSDSLFEFKNKIKNIWDIDYRCLICRDIWYMMFYFILWFSWNVLAKAILCTNGK